MRCISGSKKRMKFWEFSDFGRDPGWLHPIPQAEDVTGG